MGHSFNLFLIHYGVFALLALTLLKGVGIPLPVPIDLVILAAASGSASGKLVLWEAFGAVLVGMVVGGFLQFLAARGLRRSLLYRLGHNVGLTARRLDLALQRLDGVGVLGIAAVVVTPVIRTGAIPAAGLTRVPWRKFAVGLTLGSGLYIAFQFFVAYGLVHLILTNWASDNRAWAWLLLLPLAAFIGWAVYWHQTRHLTALHGSLMEEDAVLRSRACPLCRMTALADAIAHPSGRTESPVAGKASVGGTVGGSER